MRQEKPPWCARASLGKKGSWQATLFKASILSCCFLWTQAQAKTGIPIKVEPEILQEGQSVTLTPGDIDVTTLRSCKWYRGSSADGNRIFTYFLAPVISQKNGSAFTDRETGRRDCSLRITDLTPSDSGTYTLEPEGPLEHRIGAINITVPDSALLEAGVVSRIVVGSLVALTLFGSLLCVLFWACRLRFKTSARVVSAPPLPDDVPFSGQVKSDSSSDPNRMYQALQQRDQPMCNQPKW
uniref:carcinoembryonic antigen-related cell adhesion molecule 1 n=1 Tax=Podarcis muralis TaxID=64176 RepID=UPI00109FA5CD|nr:carcinoembryonic antigen-related cell adhesion molecule 1 [Podarcis muralis]